MPLILTQLHSPLLRIFGRGREKLRTPAASFLLDAGPLVPRFPPTPLRALRASHPLHHPPPLIQNAKRAEACLLLEDGRRFEGLFLGKRADALGEIVFNTAMTGYQEILTDPSYTGQLVTMTYPLIGNYGVNDADQESARPAASGFVVREAARAHSSWRANAGLENYLIRHGVVGIQSVDTRAVTRHIRAAGAMRAAIADARADERALLERIRAHPRMEGLDLARGVSTPERYVVGPAGTARFRVFAYDLGVKASSPRLLAERGCEVTVVPAETPAEEIARERPDGLFVSNGPGDPAAVETAIGTIHRCAHDGVPVFGICLGHQLIARAFGAETFKLPFGHHGANHPVRNLDLGTVEITSQNHGFAVRGGDGAEIPGAPELRLTHVNLYDGTVEGMAHRSLPVFCVQYHPEAAPGPHDSRYLFDDFVSLMRTRRQTGGRR